MAALKPCQGKHTLLLEQILSELKGIWTDRTDLKQKVDNVKKEVSIIPELKKMIAV